MRVPLDVLTRGSCEGLKAGVHATALGLAVVMGVYNAAAWLWRREPHLAVNTALYAAFIAWEQKHVKRHLAELRRSRELDSAVVVPVPGNTHEPTKIAA